MRLCGISSRFQLLSPCTGQVTHALLTRPPLSLQNINSEEDQLSSFVRLACVRHAASVHPEPGSNSQIKCLRCQIKVQNHWFFSCLYCLFRFWTFVLFHGLSCRHHSQENPNEIWINVQGCSVIQLSRFRFHTKAFIFYHIDFYLSRTFFKFFQLLFRSYLTFFFYLFQKKLFFYVVQLLYLITHVLSCQELFSFIWRFSFQFLSNQCVLMCNVYYLITIT